MAQNETAGPLAGPAASQTTTEQTSTRPLARTSDIAVAYAAELGWPIFPAGPHKRPLIKTGRDHAEHASTDAGQIRQWFDVAFPRAAIAMPTGAASGVVVIDVDAKHDGERVLREALEPRYGTLDRSYEVRTQSGGSHYYFRHPGGRIKSCVGADSAPWPEHGIDVRGDGGIVLLPPTANYEWVRSEGTLPELAPGWLAALCVPVRTPHAPVEVGPVAYSSHVDIADCLERLRKLRDSYGSKRRDGNAERKELISRLLDGRALAGVGGRDSAISRTGYIVGRALPEIGPQVVVLLAGASLRATPTTGDAEDVAHWVAKFVRAYEKGARDRREQDERDRLLWASLAMCGGWS